MAENTVKQIANNPAANPSSPSVKLTALEDPVITKMIIRGYNKPKVNLIQY